MSIKTLIRDKTCPRKIGPREAHNLGINSTLSRKRPRKKVREMTIWDSR
jgi:hypothetical protein